MKLTILQNCTYWHSGYIKTDYAAGQDVDAQDDEFAAVALSEKWAEPSEKAAKPVPNKARKSAPENK